MPTRKSTAEVKQSIMLCIQTSVDMVRVHKRAYTEQRTFFFFNKYYMDSDHVVMEQRLVK